ncbi:MAG: two-component system response regulator [Candidatus Makaraimicrobium thalassicum]|nr:MAG: two-component system response regulator [Candidatus Omnitrophota bacterium]
MAKQILIIEDSPTVRSMVKEMVEEERYEVVPADSGEEGLKKAIEEEPDLILLDISLPGIDGFDVLHRLRREPGTKSIPVIMLTSKGESGHIFRAMELKANDYIIKPFQAEELLNLIKKYI